MRWSRLLPILGLVSLSVSCTVDSKSTFGWTDGGPGGDGGVDGLESDTDTDTDADTDTDSDTDTDTDTDTGDTGSSISVSEFDEPGDLSGSSPDEDGVVEIELTDISGDSNTDQEFYLLLLNTGDDAFGFELDIYPAEDGGSKKKKSLPELAQLAEDAARVPALADRLAKLSPARQALRKGIYDGTIAPPTRPVGPPPPADLEVGSTKDTFDVRNSLADEDSYDRVTATLYAVGSSVALWVDDDINIDFDDGCDGTIDQYAENDAYGFDNCDLSTIADIVDTNILPNLEGYFGEPSDIDNDGLISVVITGKINRLTRTSDDEDVQDSFIGSYADPEVDLNAYSDLNPNTNEQEVVFVFAPDPFGYLNPNARVSIEEYTDVALLAQITRSFYSLISYNQHVLVSEGEIEEAWVREGLAALAVDLTGFGSTLYEDAWDFLDVAHITSLTDAEEDDVISSGDYGAQYLFFSWLADATESSGGDLAELLSSMVQTDQIGVDNITGASGLSMSEMVLGWQLALLAYNETDVDGQPLLDEKVYPQYADPVFITAPVTSPSKGDLYGANGYQQGINVNGLNYYYEGGVTSAPTEDESNRVSLSHADPFLYAYGQPFYGYVSGKWATQVVRVANIPYDEAVIELRANSSDFLAIAVRWNDLEELDYVVENSISPTDQSNLSFLPLPADGSLIYGLGELTDTGETFVVSDDGDDSAKVGDTDRWLLDLSDYTAGAPVDVALWLDRQYGDASGAISMDDPWIAVLPAEYIPNPTPSGVNSSSCADSELDWEYPSGVLEHLYYQLFLSTTSYDDAGSDDGKEEEEEESTSDFEACGDVTDGGLSCDEDWDGDEVSDEDEPQPKTFLEQVQVMQCTLEGGSIEGVTQLDKTIFDTDERDDDDDFGYSYRYNLGGNTTDEGEGAYFLKTLAGGSEYVIVVGGDTGYYTLNVREY